MDQFGIDFPPPVIRSKVSYSFDPPTVECNAVPSIAHEMKRVVSDAMTAVADFSSAMERWGRDIARGWRRGISQKRIKRLGPVLTVKANRVAFAHIKICHQMMTKEQLLTMQRHLFG